MLNQQNGHNILSVRSNDFMDSYYLITNFLLY